MRKSLLAGVLVLIALLVYSGPVFDMKLAVSGAADRLLGSVITSDTDELEDKIRSLEEENRYLRELLVESPEGVNSIKVYSSYPFNTKGEIAIAAGQEDGIEPGDAVVVNGDVLVGQVRSVFEDSSIVTTFFDPSWEMQVRIGSQEIDALMQGGNELMLTLIPSSEYIEEGDLVVVAGHGLPYGLEVGFVSEVRTLPGEVFQEAVMEPSVQLSKIRDVAVYR